MNAYALKGASQSLLTSPMPLPQCLFFDCGCQQGSPEGIKLFTWVLVLDILNFTNLILSTPILQNLIPN